MAFKTNQIMGWPTHPLEAAMAAAHRELRLNLAGNAGPANLARTHLHSMGPSKNASNTFSNHFATGFLCLIMPVWALLPSKVQNFEREIQT